MGDQDPAAATGQAAEAAAEQVTERVEEVTEAAEEVIDEATDLLGELSGATAGRVEEVLRSQLAPVVDRLGAVVERLDRIAEAPAARVREELPTIAQTPGEPVLVAPKRRHWYTKLPRGL